MSVDSERSASFSPRDDHVVPLTGILKDTYSSSLTRPRARTFDEELAIEQPGSCIIRNHCAEARGEEEGGRVGGLEGGRVEEMRSRVE